jgi:hypothetical protein
MANPEHVEILKQGVDVWNEWRAENPEILPELDGAYLADRDLKDAFLFRAGIHRAHLFRADLSGAILRIDTT